MQLTNLLNGFVPVNLEKKSDNIIIKVIGVGGCGGNTINRLFQEGFKGVGYVIANTDKQALLQSPIPNKLQLGETLTKGLGAGQDPLVGRNAALESKDAIIKELSDGTNLLFLTAGMGGGTGTGAIPVIAELAQSMGILTIAIVTRPGRNELYDTEKRAYDGIKELSKHVNSLVLIDNQKIYAHTSNLKFTDSLKKIDDILVTSVKGIAEIITIPGVINVDLADIRTATSISGMGYFGIGSGSGTNRALDAIDKAFNSELMNDCNLRTSAKGIIYIIYHPENELTTEEEKLIMSSFASKTGGANFKRGVAESNLIDKDSISVTILVTGFNLQLPAPIKPNYEIEDELAIIDSGDSSLSDEDEGITNSIDEILEKLDISKICTYDDLNMVSLWENEPAYKRKYNK